MNIYARIFFMGLQKTAAARIAVLLYLAISVLQTLLAIGVWVVAQKTSGLKVSLEPGLLLTYFLNIILFQSFIWSGVSRRIGDQDIRRGQLSLFLLKPFPYMAVILIEETSWRILRSLFTVPVFLFFFMAFRPYVQFHGWWFLVSLTLFPLGYLICFLIQSIIGTLAFWFEDIEEIADFFEVLMILFSGIGVPIFFFPKFLQTLASILPYQYALYVPTMVSLGKVSLAGLGNYLVIAVIWLVVLGVIFAYLWGRGLRRYQAEGL